MQILLPIGVVNQNCRNDDDFCPGHFPQRMLASLAIAVMVLMAPRIGHTEPLFAFTPFPFDLSQEALDKTWEFTEQNGSMFALHFDQCIPWQQMLDGVDPPQWMLDSWSTSLTHVKGRPVYVALTPTGTDRHTIIQGCGDTESNDIAAPASLLNLPFDDPRIQAAYLAYAERLVATFHPRYLDIAIEINQMLLEFPDEWPAMESLLLATYHALKVQHPDLIVGIEAELQPLLKAEVATAFQRIADSMDFLGISFYPYGSDAGAAMGAPALEAPPQQWQAPLKWLSTYTQTPLAIAETGYSTASYQLTVNGVTLDFSGTAELQRQYLHDLLSFAHWDQYLFVIWFVPIDFDRLTAALGATDNPAFRIFQDTGLLDENLNPRPAFDEWKTRDNFAARPDLSGLWFNPQQNGHGFELTFIDWNRLVAFWYTYNPDGNPLWLLADGPVDRDSATLTAMDARGMVFGVFDPSTVTLSTWGEIQIHFLDCNRIEVNWTPVQANFSAGSTTMSRLSAIGGLANCK